MGFLADFEFYIAALGIPSGPLGFVAALGFKILDSQPEKSNMGPVWTDVYEFEHFQKKLSWLSGPVFTVFSAWSSKDRIFELCDREQKDARRKVMQIRGGNTSRSAFFCIFRPI